MICSGRTFYTGTKYAEVSQIQVNEESVGFRAFTEQELKILLRQDLEMFGGAFHFVVKTFYPALLR
jgi:hypothetical protein